MARRRVQRNRAETTPTGEERQEGKPVSTKTCCFSCAPGCHYTRKDVPMWQHRFNIINGYRMGYTSWKELLWTTFRLHNETINIWTHLLPFAIFLIWWPLWFYQNWGSDGGLFNCVITSSLFLASCTVCGLSVHFHLTGDLNKEWHNTTFCMDVGGIVVMIFIGYVAQSALVFKECRLEYYILHCSIPLLSVCIGFIAFTDWWAKHITTKITHAPFLAIAVAYSVCPMAHAYSLISRLPHDYGRDTFMFFWWTEILSIVSFGGGFLVWKLNLPERFWPAGTFDYLGHSHQIWHMFVNGGLFFMLCSNICAASKLNEFESGAFCRALDGTANVM